MARVLLIAGVLPAARSTEGEWCSKGLLGATTHSDIAYICCPTSCGSCGGDRGTNCNRPPGVNSSAWDAAICCSQSIIRRDRICASEDDIDCILPNYFERLNIGVIGAVVFGITLSIWSVCVYGLRKWKLRSSDDDNMMMAAQSGDDDPDPTCLECILGGGDVLMVPAFLIGSLTSVVGGLAAMQCLFKHSTGRSKHGCYIGSGYEILLVWLAICCCPCVVLARVLTLKKTRSEDDRRQQGRGLKVGGMKLGRIGWLIGRPQMGESFSSEKYSRGSYIDAPGTRRSRVSVSKADVSSSVGASA